MKKAIVIGCPGSGKSTFSRALAKKTGLPLVYLDMMYHNADKTTVPKEIFLARLAKALAKDEWIIDGNYASTQDMRFERCDTVFFLDYPIELCLAGVEERMGKAREDMPWVENERNEEFMEFIKKFSVNSRPKIIGHLEKYSDREIHVFKDRTEAKKYLDELK